MKISYAYQGGVGGEIILFFVNLLVRFFIRNYIEIKDMESASTKHIPVKKVNGFTSSPVSDILSVEEPLEIKNQLWAGSR